MKTRHLTTACAAAILMATCIAGTAAAGSRVRADGAPKHGGAITVGIDSDPSTFDPTTDATLGEEQVLSNLYDTPFQIDAKGAVSPALAKSWHFATARNLIINFRHGVHYTDGTTFNAQSAKFDLARQGEKTSSYESLYSDVSSIAVTGSYQLTIRLKSPDRSFLEVLAGRAAYMVSPTAVHKYGARFGLHPIGTGPFMLGSYTPNYEVVLRRNPHYWQASRPYLNGVTFRIITNDTTKAVAVASGELQTEDYIEPVDLGSVAGKSGINVTSWTGTLTPYIPVNYHVAPLNDPKVREAISMAINRPLIAKDVFLGYATPANSMLAPAYSEYDRSLPAPTPDIAKAKKLLDGRHLSLTMQVPPTYIDESEVIQQELAAVGIKVTLQDMDWGTLVTNFYKNDFQIQAEDVTGQWPNASLILGGFFGPGGDYNGLNFSDPTIRKALAAAQRATSAASADREYDIVQHAAYADNIYIPVVVVKNLRATSSTLHGVPDLPDGYLYFRDAWLS